MPNNLSATGLTVATTDENSTDLIAALEAIYGDDINVGPESPDGQWVGIWAQAESDVLDLLVDIYNMFSPDTAYGVSLQSVVAINGMTIKPGTYTTTPVQVTASAAGTLPGLDQTALPPYQLQDANNLWTLVSSYTFAGAGTQTLIFQCATLGPITPLPSTINAQATPYNFISSVNNPAFTTTLSGTVTSGSPNITGLLSTTGMTPGMTITDANGYFPTGTTILQVLGPSSIKASVNATGGAPTTENITVSSGGTVVGSPFETDGSLRQRQAQSFALAATGPSDAVEGQLLNLADVQDAVVIENNTGGTVGGVPPNSQWCIVVGGTPAEIAGVIYAKSSCASLKGAQSYVITRPNGQPATINWDTGAAQQLYVKFGLVPKTAGITFNNTLIAQQLAAALAFPYWRLGRPASINDIVVAMQSIAPQAIVVSAGVSLTSGSGYTDELSPTSPQYYFNLLVANINIT